MRRQKKKKKKKKKNKKKKKTKGAPGAGLLSPINRNDESRNSKRPVTLPMAHLNEPGKQKQTRRQPTDIISVRGQTRNQLKQGTSKQCGGGKRLQSGSNGRHRGGYNCDPWIAPSTSIGECTRTGKLGLGLRRRVVRARRRVPRRPDLRPGHSEAHGVQHERQQPVQAPQRRQREMHRRGGQPRRLDGHGRDHRRGVDTERKKKEKKEKKKKKKKKRKRRNFDF
jgi:hypothetical protein